MALTADTTLGNLTPQIGQPISQTMIDVLKLATNAANAIYNLDLPLSAYLPGQTPVTTGYVLDTQPDLRFVGGMPQPYASDPGYILGPTQIDASNGFKGGILLNKDTNTVLVSLAGMDGFSNGQDQGSGVIWNGSNQFASYSSTNPQPDGSLSLRQSILQMIAKGDINPDTKIIFDGQSMGTALAIMGAADFVHNIITQASDAYGVQLNASNVAVVGQNGEGVPDSVLVQTTGTTNAEFANSGASRLFLVNGNIVQTGTGDPVSALSQYPLLAGEGVIQVDGTYNTNGGVGGYHSIQTSVFPGLLDILNNPDSALIRQQQTFDDSTAIAIAQFVGSIGSDGSTLSPQEGYLRDALGGIAAMALSIPGQSGNVLGAILGEQLGSTSLGTALGYLAEFATKVLFLQNPVGFAETVLEGLGIAKISNMVSSLDPAQLQNFTNSLTTVSDALTLIQAIQTGKPLPITATGLRLASAIDPGNTYLSGASNVGSGILSLLSLDNALKRGDTLAAISSGAQTLYFGVQAFSDFATSEAFSAISNGGMDLAAESAALESQSLANTIGQDLPYLNLVNDISHGNAVGTGLDVLAIAAPEIGIPLEIAYGVFNIISDLFGGGSDKQPDPWGTGRYVWNGTGISISAQGETGGDQAVSSFMNNVLASMNTLIAREQSYNPGSSLGIIPNRMPELGYGMDGYRFTDIDPLTGVQKNPSLRYDVNGNPYNATPGSPESFESLGQAFLLSALARGAIAPEWEVQTAAMQTQLGDPQAGLTEEERAGRAGDLAPPETGATQTWRPVVLDLNGTGIQTVSEAQSSVAFDVDDSGYLKNTAWIGNNDAFLTLDRNYNGQIDSGRELFSNGMVGLDRRGLAGMAWVDANHDGTLDASDPVFNELRVWQDKNGNGVVDPGEETTLAQDGITALNYTMGTFVENGVTHQMASPDLQADTAGEKVNVIPEGILVQSSAGQTSLLVTRVDDMTQVQANEDHVTGIENTELIVSSADLLANDTFGGFSGRDLTLTGVENVQHGSAYVDANGMVHFTPQTNFYGDGASFDYTVAGPNGQTGTATVLASIEHVNQPPTAYDDRTYRPIYGYTPVVTTYNDAGDPVVTGGDPIYQPYSDYSWSTGYVYHNTPVAQQDTGDGRIVGSDVDDPASSLTYQIVGNPQYGAVTMDAQGDYQYTPWGSPGSTSTGLIFGGNAINPGTDSFQVKVSDPHGASTTLTVNVPHPGPYVPPTPPGGGGGGKKPIAIDLDQKGFSFTKVDDSNVFLDVNGDGWKHRISWITPGEGLLAYDPNGTGAVTDITQIALASQKPGAQTDLEGLAAFDTNHDGVFDKNDAAWSKFGVWQDTNQNGISDPGEFKTLDQLGIQSISLTSDNQFSVVNGDTVHGIAKVTMTDGTTRNAADVTLAYSQDVQVTNPDGSTSVVTPTPFSSSGEEIDGTNGNDLLLGKNGNVVIKTFDGNDVVFSGDGNDVINAGNGNDVIYAGNGDDLITTGDGNDVVYTGHGNDVIIVGNGNDAIFAGGGNDVIFAGNGNNLISGGTGNDVIRVGDGNNTIYAGNGNTAIFAGNGDNLLVGGAGTNRFQVGSGNDTLIAGSGPATLIGGTGNDTFVINSLNDVVQAQAGGINTVESSISYVLPEHVQNLTLTGNGDLTGTGNELDDVIIGNAGNDTLIAGSGNDTLIAGSGLATLVGGAGNDTFVVNNANDVVEAQAGGINTIETSVSYTASANVQNLIGTGNGDIVLTGNDLANVITANSGNDTLIAGSGVATLIGGAGNDTFVVNNSADVVIEQPNSGIDTILSSVNYVLPANVEILQLTGTDNLVGVGNDQDSLLIGNAGNDTLIAGGGNDTLVAGTGIATLIGGAGNDTFVVNNVADVVEAQAGGINTIQTSVSYTASANVQNLIGTGSADIVLTGNDLANVITANSGNDTLVAGSGVATLIGGAGNDTFAVNNVNDVVEAQASGINTIETSVSYTASANVQNLVGTGNADIVLTGNNLNDVITANSGNDTLIAGSGVATLIGGMGNDTFVVNNVNDVVEAQAGGINTIETSVDYTASANVQNLMGIGSADIVLTGNDLANVITANSGNDTLIAGSGVATLVGGAGDDTFVVNNVADVVEAQAGGVNTIETSVSYTASANVQNLIGTGSADIVLTGNDLNDVITANSGNDTLVAGTGVATLIGGMGNDTFVVNNVSDVVEAQAGGINTIETSVSYTASANVQNLIGTGNADIVLTGNNLNDIITANSGNDTLVAGSGIATLIGGVGNDTFVVNNVGDVVEAQVGGINTIQTSVSYTASANVQNLIGTGNADIVLTGNNLNDVITANSGNDTLVAGSGVATLIGGAGNDTFVVNNVNDVVLAQAGGVNTVLTSVSYTAPANVQNLTGIGGANIVLTGNTLNDVITANTGNDTLIGGSGNDTFVGGVGNNTMMGGAGNDTYVYNLGNGLDTVTDTGGNNVVKFGAGLSLQNAVIRLTNGDGTPFVVDASPDEYHCGWHGCGPGTTLTAHLRILDANGVEQSTQGMDFTVTLDRYGNISSPLQNFQFADGSISTFSDMLVKQEVINGNRSFGSIVTGRNDDIVYAGPHTTGVWLGSGNDTVYASSAGTLVYGGGGNDYLVGGSGNDTFIGGWGLSVMEGGGGNDVLTDTNGQAAMLGGGGSDTLTGGGANDFIAGGWGGDVIATGATQSVVAFNAGGGHDIVLASPGAANTLSLGNGIDYRNLVFSRNGNDLVLGTGGRDSVTFKDWYANAANHSFVTLQVIEEASGTYNPRSTDPLRNQKVEEFDFAKLVDQFDAVHSANPQMNSWSLMNGMLDSHLAGSDTAALGGDLAYQFGVRGTLAGMDLSAIQATLKDPQFGKTAQTVHAWNSVSQTCNAFH